jgi:hypothetical protein
MECLVVWPISPVRGTYVVDSFVSFGVEPAVIPQTATGKSDDLHPCAVDNRELQVAVERRGIYLFPLHDR